MRVRFVESGKTLWDVELSQCPARGDFISVEGKTWDVLCVTWLYPPRLLPEGGADPISAVVLLGSSY